MTWDIIVQIILFGIALSMDAFAVAVTDGLIYTNINKRRSVTIAGLFGIMQAVMPLIGFWAVELVTRIVGESAGETAGNIMALVVTWISFLLLLYIGGKMLIDGIKSIKLPPEEKQPRKFSFKEVFIMSIATAIDALAVGVSLHTGLSSVYTIWLHAGIIMTCTFFISLIGVFFGRIFERLFKGKYEITSIVGGAILICLGIWVILSHYFGI